MAKYRIVERHTTGEATWWTAQGEDDQYIVETNTQNGPDECEKLLRAHLAKRQDVVVKEIEI